MEKVIITGANGFLGSTLTHRLVKNQVEVFAVDVDFSTLRVPESPLVHRITVNLDDKEGLFQSLSMARDSNAFYHFAWRGVNGPEKANPTVQLQNIQMSLNCAEVANKLDCKRFLCAGTVAEQSLNSLPLLTHTSGGMIYAAAKHSASLLLETYCKLIGISFVWMQFSNCYGIGNKTGNLVSYTLAELMDNREPSFGPAEQPYDFIYVDDLIEAVYRLGESDVNSSKYFIGSGEPRILKEYLLKIGDLYGKPHFIKLGARPDDGIKYDFSMFDTTPLKEAIGDYVSTPFEEGIRKTINWLKEA